MTTQRKKLSEIGKTITAAPLNSTTQYDTHIVLSPEERRGLVKMSINRWEAFKWTFFAEKKRTPDFDEFIASEGL